jgi:hypothetical protein
MPKRNYSPKERATATALTCATYRRGGSTGRSSIPSIASAADPTRTTSFTSAGLPAPKSNCPISRTTSRTTERYHPRRIIWLASLDTSALGASSASGQTEVFLELGCLSLRRCRACDPCTEP